MGAHQRSTSVKEIPATPNLKPPGYHRRQASLDKTPALRRPSESNLAPTKLSIPDSRSAQNILPKRQISPSRVPSQHRSLSKPKSNVSTRSSSIANRDGTNSETAFAGDKKPRTLRTPPGGERPSFNTHQQKFSPQKQAPTTGKDATVEQAYNPYAKGNLDANMELLHLHALHRGSGKVQKEWFESAKESYRKQFDSLVSLNATLNEREKDMVEQHNAAAMMAWGSQGGGHTIERKLQVLSSAVAEACELTASDGKYTLALQAFEHWYEAAEDTQRRRLDRKNTRVDFLEGLGDGWKAEMTGLQARVVQVSNNILSLGDVHEKSDLSRCVTSLSEMLMNMLEELEMMQFIEEAMVGQEHIWVQTSIDRMASDLRDTLPE